MSEVNPNRWRTTGAGHFAPNGEAVYPVTNGLKQLSHRDHDELQRLLRTRESEDRLYHALDNLVDCLRTWEAENNAPVPWYRHIMEADAALSAHRR